MLVGTPQVTWLSAIQNASLIAKAYLVAVLIHSILLVILSIVSLDDGKVDDVYAYLGVFCACCFVYFSFQGVLKDNIMQLRCAILSAVLISVYLIWYCIFKEHETIIIVIAITSGVLCLSYLIMYKWIVDGFGWYRYNKLKVLDNNLEDMYYSFQVFKAIIFLDIEMVTVMWILIFTKLIRDPAGIVTNIAILAFQLAWSFLGLRAVRAESIVATRVFLFLASGLFAFVGYNTYEIFAIKGFTRGTSETQYIASMALALVVRCLLLYWLFKVANNYDKGLKQQVFDTGMEEMNYWDDGTRMSRMSRTSKLDTSPHSNYQLMDEKHVIIEKEQNAEEDTGDYTQDSRDTIDSKSKSTGPANFTKSVADAVSVVKKIGSELTLTNKNKKPSSNQQPPAPINRMRLESDEFD